MKKLKAGRETLRKLWDDGLSGSPLLVRHTDIVDQCISDLFNQHPEARSNISIIATGGYGREELFPFSDIDLLFLHTSRTSGKLIEKVVSAVLYPLWDSGLEVGHSVRTPKQCIADCKDDFHLQTSLLGRRLVAGSEKLMEKLTTRYRNKFVEGRRGDFFEKISASRNERHAKFGGHNYQLEPDIKEGLGGSRDIQTMQWTAKVLFGINTTEDMEGSGLISREERKRLEESTEALIKIRNRLHYLSGRKNDQLFYEHQESIANALGIKDSPGQIAVEAFMQELYKDLQNIKIITDLFFEHTSERTVRTRPTIAHRELDAGLEIVNDTIRLSPSEQITKDPSLLMSVFSHAIELNLPVHYRSRQIVSEHLDLVDDSFRKSRKNAKKFFNILSGNNPVEVLSTMLETGLLRSYIPEFGKIESLALHDVYHVYTVDRHLLQAASEVHILAEELADIFTAIESTRVLFLASLLHDVGKGSGRDHSSAGEEISYDIGRRLALSESEFEDLAFLIRNHLIMSHTAQRRDLDDQNLIMKFAEDVTSIDRLNMLYLLSIADSKATGPSSWTDWKGALLQELYLKTANFLESSSVSEPDYEQAADWMREQVGNVVETADNKEVHSLPDDYLINFTPNEIKTHFKMREQLESKEIASSYKAYDDHWSILIVSRDKPGLLVKICGTLALNNLAVLAAKVNTLQDGTVIDLLDVKPEFNIEFSEHDWQKLDADLLKAVNNQLGFSHRLADKQPSPGKKQNGKSSRLKSQIITDNMASDQYTIIEIYGDDKPSLLYNITRTFAEFEINISRAMISTRLEQLVDVFYIQDRESHKISDPAKLNELKEALLHAIG